MFGRSVAASTAVCRTRVRTDETAVRHRRCPNHEVVRLNRDGSKPCAVMGIQVRPAGPADGPSLDIVRQQAMEAAYAERYDREAVADVVATPPTAQASWLAEDRYVALVGETPVTPAGYAVGDPVDGRLAALYVAPDYQGRGYGTTLLEAIETRLREAEVATLVVDAPAAAGSFFTERGFEQTGTDPAAAIPTVTLEKQL